MEQGSVQKLNKLQMKPEEFRLAGNICQFLTAFALSYGFL